MKPIYRAICVTACIAAMTSTAIADEVNSETCAAALSPTAKTIYEAVAPSVDADTNLKKLIKKTVRPMVMSGKMKRKQAKENAPLAGECLQLLKSEKQG